MLCASNLWALHFTCFRAALGRAMSTGSQQSAAGAQLVTGLGALAEGLYLQSGAIGCTAC